MSHMREECKHGVVVVKQCRCIGNKKTKIVHCPESCKPQSYKYYISFSGNAVTDGRTTYVSRYVTMDVELNTEESIVLVAKNLAANSSLQEKTVIINFIYPLKE